MHLYVELVHSSDIMASLLDASLVALQELLQNPLITIAFVLALALVIFCVFLVVTFLSSIVAAAAWSAYENTTNDKGFRAQEIVDALGTELAALGVTLGVLFDMFVSAAGAVARALLNNPIALLVFLATFILAVEWDTWHNVLLQSAAEAYTCFFAPIWRSIEIPLFNLITLIPEPLLPILNGVKEVWVSISTMAFIDAILCAGNLTLQEIATLETLIIGNIGHIAPPGQTPVGILEALVQWLQLPSTNGSSALQQGIDLFGVGQQIGMLVTNGIGYANCLCAPVSRDVIVPILAPFASNFFAQAFNQTANLAPIPILPFLSPVLITQGILRPIIQTFQNAGATSGGSFAEIFSRPSFNSTFDTAENALTNATAFIDDYGPALFNITDNIIREILSSCPSHPPFTATGLCSNMTMGVCDGSFLCRTSTVVPFGCCKEPQVNTAVCEVRDSATCLRAGTNNAFFEGQQCALVSGCPVVSGCCLPTGAPGSPGVPAAGGECVDDLLVTNCGGPFFPGTTCQAAVNAGLLVCSIQVPLTTVRVLNEPCGNCPTPGASCACTGCFCPYTGNETPAPNLLGDTIVHGVTACATGTVESPTDVTDVAGVCRVPLPLDVQPPVPAIVSGLAYIFIDAPFIQLPKLLVNILFNIDIVFTHANGFEFFEITDTIGPALRRGSVAIGNVPIWIGNLTLALGVELSTSGDEFSTLATHRATQHLSETQRAALDDEFTVQAISIVPFQIASTTLVAVGNLIITISEAAISTLEFFVDQLFGTIYFTINTGIANGIPDPFAYARLTFGDDAPTGIHYLCQLPAPPGFPPGTIFTAFVNDAADASCSERVEIQNVCRLIFARATAPQVAGVEPYDVTPAYITIVDTSIAAQNQAIAFSILCVDTVQDCAPFVVPDPLSAVQPPPNRYEQLLEKYVDIFRVLDPLVVVGCPFCEAALISDFFSGFIEPLVPIALVLVDFVVHLPQIVTTSYIACLDVEGAFNSVSVLGTHLSNLLRIVSNGITHNDCVVGLGARDSRILCVLAQAIDSAINIFAQLGLLIWHIVQILILILNNILQEGTGTNATLLDTISIEPLRQPIFDLSFDFWAVIWQVIPSSVTCVLPVNPSVGCCFAGLTASNFGSVPTCLPRQTSNVECLDTFRRLFPDIADEGISVETFFGATCAQAELQTGQTCGTAPPNPAAPFGAALGCCLTKDPLQTLRAASCTDEASTLLGQCQGAGDIFVEGQPCSVAAPQNNLQCPPADGPVQTVLADAFGTVTGDVILLIPEVALNTALSLIKLVIQLTTTNNPVSAIVALVEAFFTPIFATLVDVFGQLARVFTCAGASDIADALNLISDVLDTILNIGLEVVSDLVVLVVLLVFGIIQVVTTFEFTLLELAASFLAELLIRLAFAIFGSTVICGFQNTLCFLGGQPTFFAVDQCRIIDCCATPPVEPCDAAAGCLSGGSVHFCTGASPPDTVITSCAQVGTTAETMCPVASRKRSLPFHALYDETRATTNTTITTDASHAFCGGYLATLGVDKARESSDHTARMCLRVMDNGDELTQSRAAFRAVLQAELEPAVQFYHRGKNATIARWRGMHETAQAQHRENIASRQRDPSRKLQVHPDSYSVMLKRHHGIEYKPARARTIAEKAAHTKARRALYEKHLPTIFEATATNLMTAMMHAHTGWTVNDEGGKIRAWARRVRDESTAHWAADKRKRRVTIAAPLTEHKKLAVAFSVSLDMVTQRVTLVLDGVASRLQSMVKSSRSRQEREQHRASAAELAQQDATRIATRAKIGGLIESQSLLPSQFVTRFANVPMRRVRVEAVPGSPLLGNQTLDAIGAFLTCNASRQVVCTGCLLADNFIGAGEDAINNIRTFYTAPDGYQALLARRQAVFVSTLVDPIGTDTYTTENKTTVWLFDDLVTMAQRHQYFFQWDYSQFIGIATGNGSDTGAVSRFVGQTTPIQEEREAEVGREDLDVDVLHLFGFLIDPALNFIERLVAALSDSTSISVLADLYETYIACDYDGALNCKSSLGIGLFPAFVNVVIFALIIVIIVNSIVPGATMLVFMMTALVGYVLTLWIAYGASPLCTLPSFFPFPGTPMGVIGIPVCFLADLNDINARLVPQCPPTIPVALIDPSALAEASTTLCATCGTAPPLSPCSRFGFIDGLDNFFYITGSLFPPTFNEFVADNLGLVVPIVAQRAALYTPAYIASLGEGGFDCNNILITNLFTAAVIVSLIALLFAAVAGILFFFILLALFLYFITLFFCNLVLLQMDKFFVHGTRVQKLAV